MPDTLTPEQEARLEAEVWALESAAYHHAQNGDMEESFRLQRAALASWYAIVGPVNESLADGLVSLAIDLRDEGQYEEAEALFLRALSVYESLHGLVDLEVAATLFDLGCLYDDWERYEMSLPVYRRALAIEETICGRYSPEAAATCTWLGDAHVALSQYAQAEPYLRRALNIWLTRRALDDGRMLTLTQERLAGMLFSLKRYAEALAAYDDVLALNDGKFQWKKSRRRYKTCRVRCTSGKGQDKAAGETPCHTQS